MAKLKKETNFTLAKLQAQLKFKQSDFIETCIRASRIVKDRIDQRRRDFKPISVQNNSNRKWLNHKIKVKCSNMITAHVKFNINEIRPYYLF